MAIAEDLTSKDLTSIIESTAVPGQAARAVVGPDGGPVNVNVVGGGAALTPTSGQVVVAAGPTATALGAGQQDKIIVIAKITNTANIVLGPAGVTLANGLIMEPGREEILENVNLAQIFINGTAAEGVSWFALT